MEPIFDALNEQIESLTTALQANLTLADNFLVETKQLALGHDTAEHLTLTRLKKVTDVRIGASDYFEYHRLAWDKAGTTRIRVKAKWDTPPGRKVNVLLYLFGE
jgi:hypothetical protein